MRTTPRSTHRARTAIGLAAAALAGTLALPAPPVAAATTTVATTARVSVTTAGGEGELGTAADVFLDGSGRYAFFSSANAMASGDTNTSTDGYRKDRLTGTTERVTLIDDHTQIAGNSRICGVSGDGTKVGFRAMAPNLSAATAYEQVFVRDLTSRTTVLASRSTAGGAAASGVVAQEPCPLDEAGDKIAFVAGDVNLAANSNGLAQVYVRDLTFNMTALVSSTAGGAAGTAGTGVSGSPTMSGDGTVVAFESFATNLVAGDTNTAWDVFARHLLNLTTTRVSTATNGGQGAGDSRDPAISQDGRYVAFQSGVPTFAADDDNGSVDVFRKDRITGSLALASISSTGVLADDGAVTPAITPDGRYVAFASHSPNLYAADGNASFDVFRHDFSSDRTDLASRVAGSVAAGNGASNGEPAIDDSGQIVGFASHATNLVPHDLNGVYDVFVHDFATDIAPFASLNAFATQQLLDFTGQQASPSTITSFATLVTSGGTSPDHLIVTLADGTTWSGKRAPLIRLYWAFFLRAPDLGGMDYWTKKLTNGSTLAQVAAKFAQSSEFTTKYGSKTNQQFVTLIYQNVFDREPDANGLAYWTKKLDTKEKTRGDVMVSFSESSEGKRLRSPAVHTILIHLGMLRTMPPKALFDSAVAAQAAGEAPEVFAGQLRHLAAYAARI